MSWGALSTVDGPHEKNPWQGVVKVLDKENGGKVRCCFSDAWADNFIQDRDPDGNRLGRSDPIYQKNSSASDYRPRMFGSGRTMTTGSM